MAGHARFTAVLDACVIFPLAVCDSLLSVASTGLFAAKWTTRIETEWMRSLQDHTGKPPGAFDRRRDCMREAFPDWEVPESAWRRLTTDLELPDPDDTHVLAAAIAGHADCIVTSNLKDFPDGVLKPFGLEAIHPDQFLVAQLDLEQLVVLTAFKEQRLRLRKPEFTAEAFANALEKNGLVATAQRLREAVALI
jgi:hypothetical protein